MRKQEHEREINLVDEVELGATNQNELAETARKNLGRDSDPTLPLEAHAIRAISDVIRQRMRNESSPTDSKLPAVFLVSEHARQLADNLGAIREPIIDNGSVELTGKVWVVSAMARQGYVVPSKFDNAATLFDFLEQAELDQLPTLYFDPKATNPALRLYPRGTREAEHLFETDIDDRGFSLERLEQALERYYETSIKTPDILKGSPNPWLNPTKHIPKKDAEACFQSSMLVALSMSFATNFYVRWEFPGTQGRCDLLLIHISPVDGSWTICATFELKVLRAQTSTGKASSLSVWNAALSKGADQAIAYKGENRAQVGMLCCFDMRKNKDSDEAKCLQVVQKKPYAKDIEFRYFKIHASSEGFRAKKFA